MIAAITKSRAVVCVCAMMVGTTIAQPWSFTKIVDSETIIPGSSQKFDGATSFQYVGVLGDRIAFRGQSKSGSAYGVYEWSNGAGSVIADQSDLVPGTSDIFYGFQQVSPTVDAVIFSGGNNDNSGYFSGAGAGLLHVADRTDIVPGRTTHFSGWGTSQHSVGRSTVFKGFSENSNFEGIYRSDDGVLSRIADKTMSPPGHTETFSNFVDWRLDGDATCFTAATSNGYAGIFRSQGGQLTKIMDSNDVDPDGHRLAFPQYVRPAGANTVFNAYTDINIEGIYIKTSSGIDKLVDETMAPPDGSSTTYGGIGTLDYQNNTLIFQAGNDVIYTNYGGTMQRLVGPGDTLDGKRVIAAVFDEHGFDGTTAAFWVIFAGDSSFHYDRAIYAVTIPAPGAAGLTLAFALVKFSRRQRTV